MPWAIRRSLSPNTAEGIETLRSTLLTKDNRVQWETLLDLVAQATAADAAAESDEAIVDWRYLRTPKPCRSR